MGKPEFHIKSKGIGPFITEDFAKACAYALEIALRYGITVNIDVICWDEQAADRWGGGDAVETYREDPDASVFERIEVKANSQGRVP